ncbi:protein kinase [Crocosphaera sp. UHCC 0190]|uniref:protein kinase domain-containing protein n=1 Tax=Crocosphaera sp. UHCC 0190 TaxID=3110246 RepID=UPI002B20485A|nr:protein kinase [Crocosphaera sp. UHCC 0190]MEA5509087.1 protein kinase [Crocosphaera sp. UHCC 0190]
MDKVILTIIAGKLKGQKFEFIERNTCIMGRHPDCYPRLSDDLDHNTISRYHCLLDINPPEIRVRDFGSKNGTYVNDKKIGQREATQTPEEGAKITFPEYDLKSGDELKLSQTIFQVAIETKREVAPTLKVEEIPNQPKNNFLNLLKNLLKRAQTGEENLSNFKDYEIIKKLGEGGFSEVFLAHNKITGENVALKMMLPQVAANPYAVELFLREAQNTQALNHPNIVKLRDTGYLDQTFFFTLEYCNGGTVEDLMQQQGGKLSLEESLEIIYQVLDALIYAHNVEISNLKQANGTIAKGKGLVHRDIKPANIFLVESQGKITVKLADYGLSKAFDLAGLSGQTMTGTKAGTPYFMPRQQVLNFKYVQPEVDIWAVAATLYNMLTGCYPRDLDNKDPFLAILQDLPIPIRQRNVNIPQGLADIIDLALQDNPQLHFKEAIAFKKALLDVV